MYKNGYVTITQKDIQNYYENGVALPEKALFLMYEDGRRDTAIFAQKIMENFNYKATVLTYAEKFNNHDTKFRIGSISKTFTATLIMKMVEDGKLTLETKLSQFYPKVINSDKITIGGNVMFVNDDDIDVESEMTHVIGLQNRASLNYSTMNINNPNSFDMFVQCL